MEDSPARQNAEPLTSPGNTPFPFTITIKEQADKTERSFHVSGNDPSSGSRKECTYLLPSRQHSSYLTLFQKLSGDFGLRMPHNRQAVTTHALNISYQELLTKNLVPEMLYGYGDPAVLRVENEKEKEPWFYLLTTSNDAPDSFPICRSRNLTDWEFVGFVFPKGSKPAWAAEGESISDYWAPEMIRMANEYRVYFVARDKNTFELCIGIARSAFPKGPFIADPEPILKGDKIDPHVFVENNKTAYLYWKEDNNGIWPNRLIDLLFNEPTLISHLFITQEDRTTASFMVTLWQWLQTLNSMEAFIAEQVFIESVTADFANFKKRLVKLLETQLISVNNKILSIIEAMRTPVYAQQLSENGSVLEGNKRFTLDNDLEWEAHLVEGIWVTKAQNRYYLFYSGNDFSTDKYGVGVAIADNPLGPFKKMSSPILKSSEKWWAPGHPSVAIGPGGKPQLFLHAFFPNKAGYKEFRALLTVPIMFGKDMITVQ